MSVAQFNKLIKGKVLQHILEHEDKIRARMNMGITVMDITPEILRKNFEGLSKEKANNLYKVLRNTVYSNTKKFTTEQDLVGVNYLYKNGKITLIADNFNQIESYLSNVIAKNKDLIDTELGLDQEEKPRFNVQYYRPYNFVGISNSLQDIQEHYNRNFSKIYTKYKADFIKDIDLNANKVNLDLTFTYITPKGDKKLHKNLFKGIINALSEDILDRKSSKSAMQSIKEQISDKFLGKKPKKHKSKTSTSGRTKAKTQKVKVKTKQGKKAPKLRDTKGHFTSTIKIKTLIEPLVERYVKADMDSAEYFKTRTGRFTKSVEIGDIIQSNKSVIINYNYMQEPYEVFEAGGQYHRFGREPSKIIEQSIRMAAVQAVGKRFDIMPRRVRR